MTTRPIITLENPKLRERAHKVRSFGSGLQTLINDMIETMREAPGVGLAAPQVSASQRVIVVEWPLDEDHPDAPRKLYAVVNPEITRRSPEMVEGVEGCLSIPGYVGDVERHEWVTVTGLNRHGRPFRLKSRGWLARIFQHEIDHLDGVLFIDRASEVWQPEQEPAEVSSQA